MVDTNAEDFDPSVTEEVLNSEFVDPIERPYSHHSTDRINFILNLDGARQLEFQQMAVKEAAKTLVGSPAITIRQLDGE